MARRYRDQLTSLPEQHAVSTSSAKRMLRLLRLSVLLTHRRNPQLEPAVDLESHDDKLTLSIDAKWLESNPLTAAELEIEANRQTDIGWPLQVIAK
jgi:exopolyphosphatase/guanosine-5'-triphosphate,3'-diphosphate pyrophosphatase